LRSFESEAEQLKLLDAMMSELHGKQGAEKEYIFHINHEISKILL
jgi:hypothetical protein